MDVTSEEIEGARDRSRWSSKAWDGWKIFVNRMIVEPLLHEVVNRYCHNFGGMSP
jgi:hypothetical protein